MKKYILSTLTFLAASATLSQAALVWTVGINDGAWPTNGVGGGAATNFWQETGTNALPGNPANAQADQQSDDDYYFAGSYTNVIAGNGSYSPVGSVGANEDGAERAFAGTDNDLRYHFNLGSYNAGDLFSITFDANNIHEVGADSRYGVEIWVNGVQVMPEVLIGPNQTVKVGDTVTSPNFTLGSVGAVTGPGYDNIVALKGINYGGAGGGQWLGIDYVQMDVTPVPEPGSAGLAALAAVGALGIRRRRR